MNEDGMIGVEAQEQDLVHLYADLTGASESSARSVFMYVCGREQPNDGIPENDGMDAPPREEPVRNSLVVDGAAMSGSMRSAVPAPSGG